MHMYTFLQCYSIELPNYFLVDMIQEASHILKRGIGLMKMFLGDEHFFEEIKNLPV